MASKTPHPERRKIRGKVDFWVQGGVAYDREVGGNPIPEAYRLREHPEGDYVFDSFGITYDATSGQPL